MTRLRNRPAPARHRPERTGALLLIVAGFLLYISFSHQLPFTGSGDGQLVRARFADASEVNTQTPVRVGGVNVGQVQAVDAGPGNTTTLVMRITTAGIAIHRDASARIAWRTLLGGSMYIDLNAGSPSAPRLDGPIPQSDTSSQVDWDQLNGQFPTGTRLAMKQTLAGLRAGFSSPAGVGRTITTLGPALNTVGQGAQALRGQNIGDLPSLVRTSAAAVNALSADTSSLRGIVDGAARTLAVTAADRTALAQTLQLAPPALDSTTLTMRDLNSTLIRLDPLVTQLRPGARELAPTTTVLRPMLSEVSKVLRDAVPLLRAAPPALDALGTMSTRGTPLVKALTPTIQRLNSKLIPFLNSRDSDTGLRIYEAIGPFFSDVSSAASQFDGSSFFLHFDAAAGLETLLLPCDLGMDAQQLSRCNAVNAVLKLLSGGKP